VFWYQSSHAQEISEVETDVNGVLAFAGTISRTGYPK
jgi:hypothetical protein